MLILGGDMHSHERLLVISVTLDVRAFKFYTDLTREDCNKIYTQDCPYWAWSGSCEKKLFLYPYSYFCTPWPTFKVNESIKQKHFILSLHIAIESEEHILIKCNKSMRIYSEWHDHTCSKVCDKGGKNEHVRDNTTRYISVNADNNSGVCHITRSNLNSWGNKWRSLLACDNPVTIDPRRECRRSTPKLGGPCWKQF